MKINKVKKILITSVLLCSSSFSDPVTVYGFVLPTFTTAAGGVETFGRPNMGAYTAAGNPILAVQAAETRSTFQVAQSRFGISFTPVAKTSGKIEFDLIDFSKSSPTTAAVPRVRRAYVEYAPSESFLFRLGQDWDLISPLAPHSYNYIGHYFESGDIGFMRHQAQFIFKSGDFEHAFALGLPWSNSGVSDDEIELNLVPTLAVRETLKLGEESQAGISALLTSLRMSPTDTTRFLAGAVTAFWEITTAGKTSVRAEGYFGQNTVNLGMLGLGFRNSLSTDSVREAGAYVTAKVSFAQFAVFGGVGGSLALNPADVLPSYSGTALSGTGPGIENNWTVRVGAENKINDKFILFAELAGLFTRHHLDAADVSTQANRAAAVLQVGSQLSF